MPIHDHEPSFRGKAFLWGGIALGILFLAALLTHGFGLFGGGAKNEEPPALMVRHGDQIVVPEGSALRKALTVKPAAAQPVNAKIALPAVVESDPARTAAVLTPLSGRLISLKVSLGDRVKKGQVLAVIDSPDLGQAYDDDDKAADSLKLADKNLERQEGQHRIGAASDKDLDQAKSDRAQALAEYTRTQARLRMLGASADKIASVDRRRVHERQRHRAVGRARRHDQRSDPGAHDHRRFEHRLGHRAGSGEGREGRLQGPARRGHACPPTRTRCFRARCCSSPT